MSLTFKCRRCKGEIILNSFAHEPKISRLYPSRGILCSSCDLRANAKRKCEYCNIRFSSAITKNRHKRRFHQEDIVRY